MYKRGVYSVWERGHHADEADVCVYIGSTSCGLTKLEDNHRNWQLKGYSGTDFRKALVSEGESWYFSWAIQPAQVSQAFIEIQEQALIQFLKPKFNKDMRPYESSIRYGRYERGVV